MTKIFTGSVPGIAASNNATWELADASNLVPAALNNLDSLKIWACISNPTTLLHLLQINKLVIKNTLLNTK